MNINWYGLIAAIIATCLGLTLLIGVAAAAWAGRPVSDRSAEVIVGIFTILGAALTAFFAMKGKNDNKEDK